MKKFLSLSFLLISTFAYSETAVTYKFSGGRLGDNLLVYAKAFWVSYNHNIPLLNKPFTYADQLMLSKLDGRYQKEDVQKLQYIKNDDLVDSNSEIVYCTDLYFTPGQCREDGIEKFKSDKNFLSDLRKRLSPLITIKKIKLKPNVLNIAVHVRKGFGYDLPLFSKQIYSLNEQYLPVSEPSGRYSDIIWPLKFPPDQFYIDQINRVVQYFTNEKLYVHIFSDHPKPSQLVKLYKQHIKHTNISFGYRNPQKLHIFDDFFSMPDFDILIRPQSAFSIVAELLGDYKMVISPINWEWRGKDILIITEVIEKREGI